MAAGEGAPLFSLVMCLYGVEAYAPRAVTAMLAQEFSDFELVLVDDASPDGSLDVALSAADGDPRVRVVRHERNRGLSGARNSGLEAARGRYVSFPDPDDTFGRDFLLQAAQAVFACDPDIVVEGVTEVYERADGSVERERPIVPDEATLDGAAVARAVLPLEVQTLVGYVNCKFFRRDLVGSLRFEEGTSLSEDFFFSIEMFERASRVAVVPCASYRYFKRPAGSLTSRWDNGYYDIHRRRVERLYRYLCDHGLDGTETRRLMGVLFGRYIVSALMRACDPRSPLDADARRAWCAQVFSDPLFDRLVGVATSDESVATNMALAVLRTKNANLALALGRGVGAVRGAASGMFGRIQQKR
ncbi:glycosyltransferase family 2 protein [Atopobiaceae bacterium 24-176]